MAAAFAQRWHGACGGTATTAGGYGGTGLAREESAGGEEEPVQQGAEGAIGSGIVHGRPHNDTVGVLDSFHCLQQKVILEGAVTSFAAFVAGNAALYGLFAQLLQVAVHPVLLQGFGNVGQGSIGATFGIGASVNEQNFHNKLLEVVMYYSMNV